MGNIILRKQPQKFLHFISSKKLRLIKVLLRCFMKNLSKNYYNYKIIVMTLKLTFYILVNSTTEMVDKTWV